MKKNVIISLADSKYFDLLNELVNSIKSFKESQNTVTGFFVQCYSDSYFSGDTYKQVLENFRGFNTLTFGILPDTVPLKDLKNRVKDLENSGCREVYIWELGESGAIDVINNL